MLHRVCRLPGHNRPALTVFGSLHQKADLEHDNMEINKKMDLQVASLKTVLESLKLETIRYLAGKGARPHHPQNQSELV